MTKRSPIEWTQATWNPIVGCSIVSPGCTNCYAMKMAARIEGMNAEARECSHRKPSAPQYDGTTRKVNGNAVWTGKIARASQKTLLEPLRTERPTVYFVNSMSDLFLAPWDWVDEVFAVMAWTPQHTYQILTKRAREMRNYMNRCVDWSSVLGAAATAAVTDGRIDAERASELNHRMTSGSMPWPLPNVWLGVSTERQKEADERIPELLATPAAVRFVSAEPLLGSIDLHALNLATASPSNALRGVRCVPDDTPYGFHNEPMNKLDWVIVGGESGPGARPMHPDWAHSLRDQCAAADVPFFFKQWGGWSPTHPDWPKCESFAVADDGTVYRASDLAYPDGRRRAAALRAGHDKAHLTSMYPIGKKRAGRLLDGALHDAMPQAHSPIT